MLNKLFLTLWVLVYVLLLDVTHKDLQQYVTKEQVVDRHHIFVTLPMIMAVKSESQLAAIIAHEIAHVTLGHTTSTKHDIRYEYNSDLMSIYYLKKAGYNICDVVYFWETMGDEYLSLKPNTHPNAQTRAYYMAMPECRNYVINEQHVSIIDARKIFDNLIKHVAGIDRYRTTFSIDFFTPSVNAYVYTTTKDKKQ